MGQQQLLLITLGVIIVGIAITVGISLASSYTVQSNKDALILDLNNLAANAYQYRIRPSMMDGGAGSYAMYIVPMKLRSNPNGSYSATTTSSQVNFVGASAQGYGTVSAICDSTGKLSGFTYTGQFF
jgi:hypothetical protein